MADPNGAGLAPGQAPPSQIPTTDAGEQLPQQAPSNNPSAAPIAPPSGSSNDATAFKCLWQNCTEQFHQSAEQLYDHVCDKHIGRKSTNNLNLQCAWANCNVQVVKRDHITSHIRVHVPLKPHRCQFCGKTFKRPQDLKKHVKTHADDTVLNGMNQNAARDNHQHQNGGFNMGNQPKGPSYYPEQHHHMQPHPPMGYGGPPGHTGAPSYYAPTQQQGYGNGYGTVSYSLGHGSEMNNTSFDTSKTLANLNAFIGDLQRDLINTKSYNQVSNRLMPLQQTGLPYLLSGGMADYNPAPAHIDVGGGHGPAFGTAGGYSLPSIDGLRTKDQLVQMAQRFEQMAQTVYEAADQAAAAGVGQPGATYVDTVDYRPQIPSPSLQLRPTHLESPMAAHSTHSNGTPVLTPPSSAGGYTSAHSPDSNHSNPRLSPATPNGSMYPSLPGPSVTSGYPSSSMAPTATLGAQSANDYRPRQGGGYLRKAQPMGPPPRHQDEMDTSDSNASAPKELSPTEPTRRAPMATMQARPKPMELLHSNIDPALSGEAQSPAAAVKAEAHENPEEAVVKTQRDARWVDIIRTLDVLKSYVQKRLENHDFEIDAGSNSAEDEQTKRDSQLQGGESAGLYPSLPQQVEASG